MCCVHELVAGIDVVGGGDDVAGILHRHRRDVTTTSAWCGVEMLVWLSRSTAHCRS